MMEMGGVGAAGAGAMGGIVSILKYMLLTVGGGALLGLIGGLVFAGIRYPNPDKQSLFSAKQKIIILAVAVVGIALLVGGFLYKPQSQDPLGQDIMAMAMTDEIGMPMTNELGLVLGQDGTPLVDDSGYFRNAQGMAVDQEGNPVDGAMAEPGPDGEGGMNAGMEVPPDGADGTADGGLADSGASDDASGAAESDDPSASDASGSQAGDASSDDAPSAGTADAPTGGTAGTAGSARPAGGMVIMGGGGGAIRIR